MVRKNDISEIISHGIKKEKYVFETYTYVTYLRNNIEISEILKPRIFTFSW